MTPIPSKAVMCLKEVLYELEGKKENRRIYIVSLQPTAKVVMLQKGIWYVVKPQLEDTKQEQA